MRAFPAVLLGLGLALALGGCGSSKSQPQSSNVYVPDAPAPADTSQTMTQATPPAPTVQPVMSTTVGGPTIVITQPIWDNFQGYLTKVGRVGDGYYAVTQDGTGGGSWACGEALCQGTFDGQAAALKSCSDANPGKTCMIFAKDNRIQMKYEIAQ
jgi:hypothetical protein